MIKKISIAIFFIFIALILLISVDAIRGNGSSSQILKIRDIDGSPFQNSLTRGRFSLIQAIANDKSFIIDKYAKTAFPDVLYANGHYYSVFIPGPALLASPLYKIGQQFELGILFVFLLGPFLIIITAIIFFKTLKDLYFKNAISLLITFIAIFGTNIYPYSVIFNAHPFSVLAITLSLYGAVQVIAKKRHLLGNFIFWFSYGFGLISDYPNAITMLPIGLVLLVESIKIIQKNDQRFLSINLSYFFCFFVSFIFIIPLLFYTKTLFGSYFTTIETHQIQGYVDNNGKNVYKLPDDPKFYLNHKPIYKSLKLDPHFTYSGFYTLLLSPERGLFFFAPILILALLGINELFVANKKLFYGLFFSIFFTIFVYSSYTDYEGGWSFGTRFFIGITPLICVFLAYATKKYLKNLFFTFSLIILGILSIAINTLGALTSRINPSSLEGEFANCHIDCSFIREIPLLNHKEYTSFVYNEYLQNVLPKNIFFYSLSGIICVFFILLMLISYISSIKKNDNRT